MPDMYKFHVMEQVEWNNGNISFYLRKTCNDEKKAREFQEGYQTIVNLDKDKHKDMKTTIVVAKSPYHKVA